MRHGLGQRYMSALFKMDFDSVVSVPSDKYTLLRRYVAGLFGVRLIQHTKPVASTPGKDEYADEGPPPNQDVSFKMLAPAIHQNTEKLTFLASDIARKAAPYRLSIRSHFPIEIFVRLRDVAQCKDGIERLNNAITGINNDAVSVRVDRSSFSENANTLDSTRDFAASLEKLVKKLGLEQRMQNIRRGMAVYYDLIDFEHIHAQVSNLDNVLNQKFCKLASQLPGSFGRPRLADDDIHEGISTIERVASMLLDFSEEYDSRVVQEVSTAIDKLYSTVSDMMGADLRHADLGGVPLKGVRWSAETMWPPEWRETICENSIALGEDLFEVDADVLLNTSKMAQV